MAVAISLFLAMRTSACMASVAEEMETTLASTSMYSSLAENERMNWVESSSVTDGRWRARYDNGPKALSMAAHNTPP